MPYQATDFANTGISVSDLTSVLADEEAKVVEGLNALKENSENISITQMFDFQLAMNKFAQVSEMSTSVANSTHQAINSMARNIK